MMIADKIFKKINIGKKTGIALIALGIALLLALFGGSKEGNERTVSSHESEDEAIAYAREMEIKIAALIERLDGISGVSVVISLESGKENVYAENGSESDNGSTKQYAVVGNETVLIKEMMPKISGVAVVCKGAGSAKNEAKIIRLLSALLNISSNHIYVGS